MPKYRPIGSDDDPGTGPDLESVTCVLHVRTLRDFYSRAPRRWIDRLIQESDPMPLSRDEEAEAAFVPWIAETDLGDVYEPHVVAVTGTLADVDPVGLIHGDYEDGAPLDEYREEAVLIVALVEEGHLTQDRLWAVFASQFAGASRFADRGDQAWKYLLRRIIVDLEAPAARDW